MTHIGVFFLFLFFYSKEPELLQQMLYLREKAATWFWLFHNDTRFPVEGLVRI